MKNTRPVSFMASAFAVYVAKVEDILNVSNLGFNILTNGRITIERLIA